MQIWYPINLGCVKEDKRIFLNAALGQFLRYQLPLEEGEEPDLLLYLAVPADTYRDFFTLELPRLLLQRYRVRLIVYDPEEEVITQWQT